MGGLSAVEIMETLAGLVLKLGQSEQDRYKSLYVLIDRIDETAHGSAAVVSLLKPLVVENRLLSMAGVAFKIFVSIEAGEQLLADPAVRSDRYAVQTITWDAAALQGLLDRRLKHYSGSRVEHFVELCATPARSSALERLLARSEGSPRTLLRLCSTLVRCHIDRTEDTLIDRARCEPGARGVRPEGGGRAAMGDAGQFARRHGRSPADSPAPGIVPG